MIELDTTPPPFRESDYPPSPEYYRHAGADCRDLVTPEYWRDSACVHLFRAGRKDGETTADAVRNAFLCLALWFRSQGLPVPFYSAELDELRTDRARLGAELAALRTPLESRPVSPTLDTDAASVDEWTDAELREWATRTHGEPQRPNDWRMCWDWHGDANRWSLVYSGGWHGHAIGNPTKGLTATEAARILGATKSPADPFAGLLEVETDEQLATWATREYGDPVSDQLDCGVGSATILRWHDADRFPVCATWFYSWRKWQVFADGAAVGGNVTARDAARTLHRILTGGAA